MGSVDRLLTRPGADHTEQPSDVSRPLIASPMSSHTRERHREQGGVREWGEEGEGGKKQEGDASAHASYTGRRQEPRFRHTVRWVMQLQKLRRAQPSKGSIFPKILPSHTARTDLLRSNQHARTDESTNAGPRISKEHGASTPCRSSASLGRVPCRFCTVSPKASARPRTRQARERRPKVAVRQDGRVRGRERRNKTNRNEHGENIYHARPSVPLPREIMRIIPSVASGTCLLVLHVSPLHPPPHLPDGSQRPMVRCRKIIETRRGHHSPWSPRQTKEDGESVADPSSTGCNRRAPVPECCPTDRNTCSGFRRSHPSPWPTGRPEGLEETGLHHRGRRLGVSRRAREFRVCS